MEQGLKLSDAHWQLLFATRQSDCFVLATDLEANYLSPILEEYHEIVYSVYISPYKIYIHLERLEQNFCLYEWWASYLLVLYNFIYHLAAGILYRKVATKISNSL